MQQRLNSIQQKEKEIICLRWIGCSIGIRCRWMMMMMMMMLHTACFDFIQSITLRDFSFFFFLCRPNREKEFVQKKNKRLQTSFVSPGALPIEYRRGLAFPVSMAELPP